nr:hypothetical protein [Tanacetum cinerariifolium]
MKYSEHKKGKGYTKQPEGPPFTDHMLVICAGNKPVAFKTPKTSSKAEKKSKGKKPGAKIRSSKIQTGSKSKATKYGSSKKAAGGLTSLGVTSEEGSYLQLSSDSIAKANPEKSAPRDSIP